MTDNPSIDPIEAFLWLLGGLGPDETDRSARRIHTAIGSDDIHVIDRACREAIKGYQRRLMGTDQPTQGNEA
ncbi:hypothetical protein P7L87_25035 [Vibrio parahaemolyticus]|nr:hypothetical protein [Vibrio parahaemolyticus]